MNEEGMREAFERQLSNSFYTQEEFLSRRNETGYDNPDMSELWEDWQACAKWATEQQIKRDAALCADNLPDRSNNPHNSYLEGIEDGVETCQSAIKNQERG